MISTTRNNYELARCLNIRYALIELFLDSSFVGSAKRIYRSAKDIFTLYALEKTLYNAILYNLTETQVEDAIFKIREFLGILNYESKVDYFNYKYPDIVCSSDVNQPFNTPTESVPETPTDNTKSGYNEEEWYTQNLTSLITADGQTTISSINFVITDPSIDVDSVFLEVQGDNPPYATSGEGWHMVGNILYWHHFYDLKIGMQVLIRWRKEN